MVAGVALTFITLMAMPLSFGITMLVFKWFDISVNSMTLGGLAVAIGMVSAAALAESLGRIGPDIVARQERLLRAFDLPMTVPTGPGFTSDALLATMARDKKTVGGRLRFVLPTRIGHVELVDGIDPAAVRSIIGG